MALPLSLDRGAQYRVIRFMETNHEFAATMSIWMAFYVRRFFGVRLCFPSLSLSLFLRLTTCYDLSFLCGDFLPKNTIPFRVFFVANGLSCYLFLDDHVYFILFQNCLRSSYCDNGSEKITVLSFYHENVIGIFFPLVWLKSRKDVLFFPFHVKIGKAV